MTGAAMTPTSAPERVTRDQMEEWFRQSNPVLGHYRNGDFWVHSSHIEQGRALMLDLMAERDALLSDRDHWKAKAEAAEAELRGFREDREFVIGWNDGFEEGLRQAEEVVRECAADQNANACRWAEAIAKAEHEWAARLIGYAADAIAALSPQDPAREQEASSERT